jgi:hypothetical protein
MKTKYAKMIREGLLAGRKHERAFYAHGGGPMHPDLWMKAWRKGKIQRPDPLDEMKMKYLTGAPARGKYTYTMRGYTTTPPTGLVPPGPSGVSYVHTPYPAEEPVNPKVKRWLNEK